MFPYKDIQSFAVQSPMVTLTANLPAAEKAIGVTLARAKVVDVTPAHGFVCTP